MIQQLEPNSVDIPLEQTVSYVSLDQLPKANNPFGKTVFAVGNNVLINPSNGQCVVLSGDSFSRPVPPHTKSYTAMPNLDIAKELVHQVFMNDLELSSLQYRNTAKSDQFLTYARIKDPNGQEFTPAKSIF